VFSYRTLSVCCAFVGPFRASSSCLQATADSVVFCTGESFPVQYCESVEVAKAARLEDPVFIGEKGAAIHKL
jgi:hypothetical protein